MRFSFLLLACSAVALVACGNSDAPSKADAAPGSVTLPITVLTQDATRRLDVMAAATRTIKNRLEAMSVPVEQVNVQVSDAAISINAPEGALKQLQEQLLQPFALSFMHEVPVEQAEVVIAGMKGFASTDLNQAHIDWFKASEDTEHKTGTVTITFTADGAKVKQRVFAEYKGQDLGLFLQKKPVYKFKVEESDVQGSSFVIKVPQEGIAELFADDMNMSRYIEFHSS